MAKRFFTIPFSKIKIHPERELIRQLFARFPNLPLHRHESGFCSVEKIYESLDRFVAAKLAHDRPAAVYAYEDGALHTFRKAKQLGIHCIYELPIAYGQMSQQLIREEALRYPEWTHTLDGAIDSAEKMLRKKEELQLADCIICPSQFVKTSIPEDLIQDKPIRIIPYGTDPIPTDEAASVHDPAAPLKCLFVGLLSQRKGLADLFEAIKLLPDPRRIELHLIGKPMGNIEFYKNRGVAFRYHGILPRSQVLQEMKRDDVFILPSIVEGRALVQLEALSQGLPLLISNHTGGEDLIIEGKTGFQVTIRNPQALADKLQWFLDHRDQLSSMKIHAAHHAQSITWKGFQQQLLDFLVETEII